MAKKQSASTSKPKSSVKKPVPRKGSSKKSLGYRMFLFFLKAFVAGALLFFLFFLVVYLGFTGPVPSKDELMNIRNPVASEVLSADGKLLGRYYIENRSNVRFEEISPNVINALIATEDSRFYQHRGIDEIALMRVFFKSILLQDRSAGGGSTLSQQIAKNLFHRKYFGPFTMPVNKIREAIIAYRLERVYTKEEILTLYLNTVPFAENTFGIEVASERFFSKKPIDLTVPEAATLVGMLKASNSYNPRKNPERSLERRNTVIDQMAKYKYLEETEAEHYKSMPLMLSYQLINYSQGPAPYLMERLRPQLLEWCSSHTKADGTPYNLYTDGLKIYTTINYDMQVTAEKAIEEQMAKLQDVFDEHWGGKDPWGNDKSVLDRAMKRSDRYRKLKEQGATDARIREVFNTETQITAFGWKGTSEVSMTPMDSLKHYLKFLNAGFLAMDPRNGELKAYIGGIDFRFFKYDHVLSARQIGSTFKPIVYLAALEGGMSPDKYFPNEQKVYEEYDNWSPKNSHDNYGGYYSMEGALSQSINTIAVDVLMQSGIENVVGLAHRMGITADLPEYPSLALGVASISLQEMLCAYSCMANGGKKVDPYFLVGIKDANGNELEMFPNNQSYDQVADAENCRIMTRMLESVINNGTGHAIRDTWGITGEFAGKTGTTQNQVDGWFIGMTPQLVFGSWVGGEDQTVRFRTINYGQGAYMALPIVGRFYSSICQMSKFRDITNSYFDLPSEDNLVKLDIPPYREILEVEHRGFSIGSIFGHKDDKKDQPEVREQKQPESEQVQDQENKEDDKKKLWKSIKNIFRKKDK